MRLHQLRNATLIIESGPYRILLDPMLGARHSLPPLRLLRPLQRNPLVDLPDSAAAALASVTHCLLTHCQKGHFDHLDRAGREFLRQRQIPVICTAHDAPYLQARGLRVQALPTTHGQPTAFLGGQIRTLPCIHGRGLVGRLMEHGVGYFIEWPDEPSLCLCGDTLLTPALRDFIQAHQPEVCVAPAGGAHFDLGGEIIMGIEELLELRRLSHGQVVANHLQALSHCPVSRQALAAAAHRAGLAQRLLIPEDGEVLTFAKNGLSAGTQAGRMASLNASARAATE